MPGKKAQRLQEKAFALFLRGRRAKAEAAKKEKGRERQGGAAGRKNGRKGRRERQEGKRQEGQD